MILHRHLGEQGPEGHLNHGTSGLNFFFRVTTLTIPAMADPEVYHDPASEATATFEIDDSGYNNQPDMSAVCLSGAAFDDNHENSMQQLYDEQAVPVPSHGALSSAGGLKGPNVDRIGKLTIMMLTPINELEGSVIDEDGRVCQDGRR